MPQIPLPKGISGLEDTPKLREYLTNLFWTPDGVFRTPGIDEFVTTGDTITDTVCRGAGVWYVDEYAYFVIGQSLYRIGFGADRNIVTRMGSIPGTGRVIFSPGQTYLVILVVGGAAYYISSLFAVLNEITDTDYIASVSVDYIDGRHVFAPADGSPAFYTDVDASQSISPLSFFDAEELPDLNKACINISNTLYVGGSQSFEQFRTTGDSDFPFERRNGGRVDVGYVAGMQRYKNTFAFIGKRRDQGHNIFLMGSGDAIPISTPRINEILAGFTLDEIEGCFVDSFEWNSFSFIVWTIGSYSFAFADGNWIYLDSQLNGTNAGPWRARGVVFYDGNYLVGDCDTGDIGVLSSSPSEYGENVEYELQTFARGERGTFFSAKSLDVDALCGQGADTIGLSLSADARTWSDFYYRNLGDTGNYDRRLSWGGGLGRYENYMGIRLRGTGQVRFALESMMVNT